MDEWFCNQNIPYLRYSDDIIVFATGEEELKQSVDQIKLFLDCKGLKINHEKEVYTKPGEQIEFLGFEFFDGTIQVSDITLKKIKGKLKRKARALYRWKLRNNISDERVIKAYIRFVNRKLYQNHFPGEITWCRWYFPIITTPDKLKCIDEYTIDCIRFLKTGNYGKKNKNLRYETIQNYGYKSLVNQFWKYKSGTYFLHNE